MVADRLAALTKELEDDEVIDSFFSTLQCAYIYLQVIDSEILEEERMELNTYARRY